LSFFDKFKHFNSNIQFERWEILALLVFRAWESCVGKNRKC